MNSQVYSNPLTDRYASSEMSRIWSPHKKFSTWRRLWLALAKAEKQLGLRITDDQIRELEAHVDDIDLDVARKKEKEVRHDVMSHIYTYGLVCPIAKPIIHLGATSCFVTDNTELILLKESMQLIKARLVKLLASLKQLALQYKDLPTLGYTHYQPAQLTTVGKRVTLWLNDFLMDFIELDKQVKELPFRGVKGTTGTQGSFLELFSGDHDKVRSLDRLVTEVMGFSKTVPVCGQTYSRKIDFNILSVLSGISQSASKMAGDIRHLMNLKEVEEPFETGQIGSSAMAYKRNPMRSERICGLGRYVISLADNAANTHANQWFERTLDDSANRRIVLPESFLATDAILLLAKNVMDGLVIWPLVIRNHIDEELPFMSTEAIIMACTKAGGDRQQLHEAIRVHSLAAARRVKEEGADNDLLERIKKDDLFEPVHSQLNDFVKPEKFIGRAPRQVEEFIAEHVDPILNKHENLIQADDEEISV